MEGSFVITPPKIARIFSASNIAAVSIAKHTENSTDANHTATIQATKADHHSGLLERIKEFTAAIPGWRKLYKIEAKINAENMLVLIASGAHRSQGLYDTLCHAFHGADPAAFEAMAKFLGLPKEESFSDMDAI